MTRSGRFPNPFLLHALALSIAILAAPDQVRAEPLSTAFTYQGEIDQGGNPLDGTADFQFSLYDIAQGGSQVGNTLSINNVTVSDGVFAAQLDFGVDVFNGEARYLQIALRSPAGGGAYDILDPRVVVSPTPYALQTRGIFVDDVGNVSIGEGAGGEPWLAGGPSFQLTVTNPTNAIFGTATAAGGVTEGVKGEAASDAGRGIFGEALSGSGDTKGVFGKSNSPDGEGLHGEGGVGACGIGDTGAGVVGESIADGVPGVHGKTDAVGGEGVRGEGDVGMCGVGDVGPGVVGETSADGVAAVHGKTTAPGGEGVRGEGEIGTCGFSVAEGGTGVLGMATGSSGSVGVEGQSQTAEGIGVYGSGDCGVRGDGTVGLMGEGENAGVIGLSVDPFAVSVGGFVTDVEPEGPFPTTAGVYGYAEDTGKGEPAHGVHGHSTNDLHGSAGVVAEGNGAEGATALDIRNGALVVSGTGRQDRPAGAVLLLEEMLEWEPMLTSCNAPAGGNHSHQIGYTAEFDFTNEYITSNCVLLITLEDPESNNLDVAYSAHVLGKINGAALIGLSAIGADNPSCTEPGGGLIINFLIVDID